MDDTIGARLRAARELKEMSIGELAKKANVSKGTLSQAERDKTVLTCKNLGRICRAIQVPTDLIIYGSTLQKGDEWFQLSSTNSGQVLKKIVLRLYRSEKLMPIFTGVESLSREQVEVLQTLVEAFQRQKIVP